MIWPRRLTFAAVLLSVVGPLVPALRAQADARLPDGTQFQFWEKPFTPTKTYYVNGTTGNDDNPGTKDLPFKTINKAAQILEPGERVVIAPGIYRESIDPARGGTGPDKLISYEAAPGAQVIVSGAMVVKNWAPSTGFRGFGFRGRQNGSPKIYETNLNGAWFGGYNPFGMVNLPQQKGFLVTMHDHPPGAPGYNMPWLAVTINLATYYRRRGLVFVDGKPLTQVDSYEGLFDRGPGFGPRSTRAVNATIVEEPQDHLFDDFGGSAGRVFIENDGLTLHIRLNGDGNPNDHLVEITAKQTVLRPSRRYLGYIRIKGIHFEKVGNGFPMPQIGLVSTHRGSHWIFEDDTFEWANSIGLDIGGEGWGGGPPPRHLLPRSVRAPLSSIRPSFCIGDTTFVAALTGLSWPMIAATVAGVNFDEGAAAARAQLFRAPSAAARARSRRHGRDARHGEVVQRGQGVRLRRRPRGRQGRLHPRLGAGAGGARAARRGSGRGIRGPYGPQRAAS